MSPYVLLTKRAIEVYIKERKIINAEEDFSNKKSGTFVTIKKEGQLRACIGTYLATKENIAEEIIHNAIAAASEDYRFGPIQEEELPYLSYTVYILSKPELAKSINGLNPKKYGIIVKAGEKSGLLLPGLEDVDTVGKQIAIACQKGRINPEIENIIIYKFTVEKHE